MDRVPSGNLSYAIILLHRSSMRLSGWREPKTRCFMGLEDLTLRSCVEMAQISVSRVSYVKEPDILR
jgi:hypothetical protein